MRKLLLLAALLFAASSAIAGNIDMTTAQTKAANFLLTKTSKGRPMASAPTVKWTHEVKNSSNASLAAYYIVNTDHGYVIVAGDDRARDILAYGDQPIQDLNDLPEAMKLILKKYQTQMEYLQAYPGVMVNASQKAGGISVDPLLTSAWAQGKPYNMKTPRKGSGSDPYCKVGCAAVALAQVMYYWRYPETSPAMPSYITETHGYVMPALPEYTFDWDNLMDTYPTSQSGIDRLTETQINAIGYLMLYVGYAETMDYATDRSGAEYDEIQNAIETFGFDPGAHYVMRWDYDDGTVNYTDEQWAALIQSELRAGRPLIYCAFDMASDSTGLGGGHAFNLDGYDAENDMYHVNFGMSAELNTWYAYDAYTSDHGMTVYDFYPLMFVGVQPLGISTDPVIAVTPKELAMEAYAGETATATFNVSGNYLTGDVTLTVNDANGVFSVDPTTVTKDDALAGKTITVTYAPQAAGTHSATITLKSEGANDVTLKLNGTATNAPLVVYDPVMLPADSAYIALTSFRADWTDQTPAQNVLSYTLQVNQKPTSGLISEADWSNVPSSGNAVNYMPEGWTYNGGVYLEGGRISISSGYSLYSNTLDLTGFDKITVVVRGKNCYTWTNSAISVKTSVDSKYQEFAADYADYTFVLNCGSSERVEIYSESYYPEIQSIKIYAGEYEAPQLRDTENDTETYRLITGITDKFYTVNNLLAEGTFLYKVKALYTDGTESAWSNTQMVTLFDNGPAPHEYAVGDVNHDHAINIADVTALIDYLLGSGNVCTICGDVNQDHAINIADVTALIDKLLSGGN